MKLIPVRYWLAPPALFWLLATMSATMLYYGITDGKMPPWAWGYIGVIGFTVGVGLGVVLYPFYIGMLTNEPVQYNRTPVYAQEATLLVNLDNKTLRTTGASIPDWVELGKLMVKKNYRFRARTRGLDYDFWRSILETNTALCQPDGKCLNFTRDGEMVMRALSLLPTHAKTMPKGVSGRLTHTYTQG